MLPSEFANAEKAIDSLARLDIGYVDLMLLHHPGSHECKHTKRWNAPCRRANPFGRRFNYYIKINEFIPKIKTKPALVQNEIHPFYQEKGIVEHIHGLGIVVEGW
ncbi:MAG: hypothetical protein ACLRSW_10190 [Christensenellaceae bacterium]